jgi:LytS/YehU family sensor histidine kinase
MSAAQWPYWLFFLLSLGTLCALFLVREKRIRRETARSINRQQLLIHLEMNAFQAQMDPHFIFNSLNAIHHYILTTSTDMASLYLTRFARLMRLMIRNSAKEWVNLEDDLEALELYLQLEQLRFGSQFDYKLEVLPEVLQQVTFVPPLIIQPYVQEAIWRRLLLRPGKIGGRLHVVIARENDYLRITVEDNGVNQPYQRPEDEQLSRGTEIAASRLHGMNEKYHLHAAVKREEIILPGQEDGSHRVEILMQLMSQPAMPQTA